jgi:hypothetical protein
MSFEQSVAWRQERGLHVRISDVGAGLRLVFGAAKEGSGAGGGAQIGVQSGGDG